MTIDTALPFTLSGEPSNWWGGTLTFVANDPYDYSMAGSPVCAPGVARTAIKPPEGMTPAQFDAHLVSSYNGLSQGHWVYNYFGLRQVTGGGNSNNANTTLLENAGVSSQQINSIKTQMASQGAKNAPGLGGSLNSPTPVQVGQSALSSSLTALSSALNSLSRLLATL